MKEQSGCIKIRHCRRQNESYSVRFERRWILRYGLLCMHHRKTSYTTKTHGQKGSVLVIIH
ncbi:hypothetical protein FKM82_007297 [Ascaphus truei]